jgi:hypothetical protein
MHSRHCEIIGALLTTLLCPPPTYIPLVCMHFMKYRAEVKNVSTVVLSLRSKPNVIRRVWRMGSSVYINLPVAWENSYRNPIQSIRTIFRFISYVGVVGGKRIDRWKFSYEYTVARLQTELASSVMAEVEPLGVTGRTAMKSADLILLTFKD